MNPSTWLLLDAEYERFPIMRSACVTEEELRALRQALPGLPFPTDFAEFLRRYGGATVGSLPIFGIVPSQVMGVEETLIEQNRVFRDDERIGIAHWLIISTDGFGNPLGIAPDGQVWVSDHDNGDVVPIAPSFEAFLLRWCLRIPDGQ